METLVRIVQRYNIYIIDNDYYNGLSVQHSLEKSLGAEVGVKVFPDAESFVQAMQDGEEDPAVVILEYTENRRFNLEQGKHMVDHIKEQAPCAAIIIFSDKMNSERAVKALAYGAHDFVMKDQFLHEHILSSVKKCLHPAKM